MLRKRPIGRISLILSTACAALLVPINPANAYVTYTDDECSSSTRCFAVFYNSMRNIGIFSSPCFITNGSEHSHLGFDQLTSSGMQQVRYQFNHGRGFDTGLPNGSRCRAADPGSGAGVKNNAAGAANGDSRAHRISYNTGYAGTYQTFQAGAMANLIPALKNNNASSKRL